MQFKTVAFGILAVCALSAETSNAWIEATSFGAMLARGEAIAKRQGYTPEQRPCGTGRTCQDACGAGSVQCPSTDNKLHCHIPSTGTHCCTDGTGSACQTGYYCTTDGRSRTYCCPDGIQNVECARLYSLTISLIRETSRTALPSSSVPLSSVTVLTPVLPTGSSLIHVSSTRSSVPTSTRASSSRVPTPSSRSSSRSSSRASTSYVLTSSYASIPLVATSTGTSATSTRTNVPEFTGGAAKVAGVGMAIFAGAAGLLF